MNIGFLIDHRRCIGCHACSVACKEEHQVPLGVYRTWVKYVEKGEFPHTRRHFAVLRCNHCANAPCVTICPVTALYKRPDGIVDFDPAVCIGCKACMQACPYDALYLDPQQGTAAKCNFCAHRIDAGLRPACEIVCPTQAILSGDLDDPDSLIARVVARAPVQVRKPEKGTRPQLFYIDADAHSLTPAAVQPQPPLGMWSQLPPRHTPDLTLPGLAALPVAPPLEDLAPAAPRTVYDVAHAVPWGRKVSLYIWSKSIAAGALLLAALGVALGRVPDSPLLSWGSLLLALVFLALTGALLIFDLKRPERFYTLFLRPQWRSWLAIGAFVLLAYGAVLGLSLLAALLGATGLRRALLWPGGLLAILAAIYTGFLFGQAKGRDFWLSPALPLHLLVQALLAGAAALAVLALGVAGNPPTARLLHDVLLWSLLADLFIILVAELGMPHGSEDARRAARLLLRGAYCRPFWGLVVALGHAVPLLLLLLVPGAPAAVSALAGLLALLGLLVFEHLWLLAGQVLPLS